MSTMVWILPHSEGHRVVSMPAATNPSPETYFKLDYVALHSFTNFY